MTMTKDIKNKIKGSLYGFAIGDAMGATTEFANEEAIRCRYGTVDHIIGGGWLNLEPGSVTDDTEMTMCVADAYIKANGFSDQFLQNCTKNFTAWLKSGPKDVGNSCRQAILHNMYEEKPIAWMDNNYQRQILSGHKDLGNGALMRCLFPILADDIGAAVLQAKLTHNNTINDKLILIYALRIRDCLKGLPLPEYNGYVPEPTGHIENTLENVFYWAYSTKCFRDSIIGPVNRGGDADTIAAITGGLTGAYYGFDQIPDQWVQELSPAVRNKLDQYTDWLCSRA